MIVCSSCGSAMEDDLRFCTECGTPNPTTRTGETTLVLGTAPALPHPSSEKINSPNPPTPQVTVPFNQRGGSTHLGSPSVQQRATATNRTLIVVCAVVSGLSLLVLGAVGSKFLLSDNKSVERAPESVQAETPRNDTATSPEGTPARFQNQTQTPTQTPARNPVPTFDEPNLRREVVDTLNSWAAAARAHDLDLHMSYYADTLDSYYRRDNVSRNYVRSSLAPAYDRYSTMDVQLNNVSVAIDQSGSVATVTLDKSYRFEGDKIVSGSVQEMLTLTKFNSRWLITSVRDTKVYYSNK